MIKAEIIFWIIVAVLVLTSSILLITACCKLAGDLSREEEKKHG